MVSNSATLVPSDGGKCESGFLCTEHAILLSGHSCIKDNASVSLSATVLHKQLEPKLTFHSQAGGCSLADIQQVVQGGAL